MNCPPHTWEEAEALLGFSCAGPWELPQAQEGAHGSSIIPQLSPALSGGCWGQKGRVTQWKSQHQGISFHGESFHSDFTHISNCRLKTTPGTCKVFMDNKSLQVPILTSVSMAVLPQAEEWPWLGTSTNLRTLCSAAPRGKTTALTLASAFPPSPSQFHLGKNFKNCRAWRQRCCCQIGFVPRNVFQPCGFSMLIWRKGKKPQHYCIKCTGKYLGKNCGDKHRLDNTLKYWNQQKLAWNHFWVYQAQSSSVLPPATKMSVKL